MMNLQQNIQFSVVIPLYNKLDHIIRTIDSVLAQTYGNLEVVIVDDGSTDGSPNLVSQLRGDRVRLVRQLNAGVSCARNRGVQEAKGDIIAFIDADDTWEPHYLEEVNELHVRFPKAEAFGTAYQFIVDGDKYVDPKIRFRHKPRDAGILNDYFSVGSRGDLPFMMSSFCIKKDTFMRLGGFPKGVPMGEDQDLFSRVALEVDIAYSPSILSFYHLDSSNRACQQIVPNEECSFSKQVLDACEDDAIPERQRRDMLNYTAAHILHIASLNIRLGRLTVAKRLLSDKRCKLQPLRYVWWRVNYTLKKLNVNRTLSNWV